MKIPVNCLLVCFALWGSSAAAATILPEVSVTTLFGDQRTTTDFFLEFSDKKTFSGEFAGPDYSWSFLGNIDPLILWGFTATTPGAYSVTFSMPVVGGPYGRLSHIGGVSIADVDGPNTSNPSSVSGTAIEGQVPTGTFISAVKLTADASAPNGGIAIFGDGPLFATQSFGFPTSMAETLSFSFASVDHDGSAGFVGQLRLDRAEKQLGEVPEPASVTLLGMGVLALWSVRRRTRNASSSGR